MSFSFDRFPEGLRAFPEALNASINPRPRPMTAEDKTKAYQRLLEWADNEDGTKTTTWDLFLSLTNHFHGENVETKPLGFLEGDLLARALAAWSSDPKALVKFLEA